MMPEKIATLEDIFEHYKSFDMKKNFKNKVGDFVMFFGVPLTFDQNSYDFVCTTDGILKQLAGFTQDVGMIYFVNKEGKLDHLAHKKAG